jgi:hypothetical protein
MLGFIRQAFGKVTIESRKESFYLNYSPAGGIQLEISYEDLWSLQQALNDLVQNDSQFAAWKPLRWPYS